MKEVLHKILSHPELHAKWLNTLSYLENCGARLIAKNEHPTLVKEEVLKHASEEFRHSHYLKSQIGKISKKSYEDYSLSSLLGQWNTIHYLQKLNIFTSNLTKKNRKESYLFVTYAIEKRAEKLYPLYEEFLRLYQTKVFVKSIVLEEEEHLNTMESEIRKIPFGFSLAKTVCSFEKMLFKEWIFSIEEDVRRFS